MVLTQEQETKRIKARNLRYKKPISTDINLYQIQRNLEDMWETTSEVKYWDDADRNVLNALCGDEDEAYEFRMAFSDLDAEIERFYSDLEEEWITDYFDEVFPAVGADYCGGYLGWDSYVGDYAGIDPYEYEWAENEAEKKLCRLTKKEILEAVGSCLKVYTQYVSLRYRFDCLEASMKILQEKNMEGLRMVNAISDAYEECEKKAGDSPFEWIRSEAFADFDRLVKELPSEYWM